MKKNKKVNSKEKYLNLMAHLSLRIVNDISTNRQLIKELKKGTYKGFNRDEIKIKEGNIKIVKKNYNNYKDKLKEFNEVEEVKILKDDIKENIKDLEKQIIEINKLTVKN